MGGTLVGHGPVLEGDGQTTRRLRYRPKAVIFRQTNAADFAEGARNPSQWARFA